MLRLLYAALVALAVVCLGCGPAPAISGEPGDQGVERWRFEPDPAPTRAPCAESLRAELLEPGPPMVLDCDLDLEPDDVVHRRLVLSGAASSGVTVRCRGGTLAGPYPTVLVKSDCQTRPCVPVHDVAIRDCEIQGGVRISGLAINGNDPELLDTDQTLEHVSLVRASAPYRVTLENSTLTGTGSIPLYISPGVHDCSFRDLEIGGESNSVMIYADSETDRLHFRNVRIDARDGEREAMALDGSARGSLVDSEIRSPRGCIYGYRNCGEAKPGAERGVIRHTTSSGWRFDGNEFRCLGPAIWFGSRGGNRSYCQDDEPGHPVGEPIGSWLSNFDWMRNSFGAGNRFVGCSVRHGDETNSGNEVE